MGLVSEFRTFIERGSVIDLAVGVVIGGAFGKIVTSAVNDLLMPPIGLAIQGIDFKHLKVVIGGTPEAPVSLNYGVFVQNAIEFLIIAFFIFLLVKGVNSLKKPISAAAVAPPPEIVLLTQIRDSLRRD